MLETWLQALPLFWPTNRVPPRACSPARSTPPPRAVQAVFLQHRCLSLMSINFKRKNKNWTKDQWNWRDIHGWTVWHLPYLCCWEVDGHNTSHYHHKSSHWNVKHKVQFKIDPYAQLKYWTFQVKNLIPSTKYMKKLTFEPLKSHISNLGQVPWIKIECPHGNFDCGMTWHFKRWTSHVPNQMHKLL